MQLQCNNDGRKASSVTDSHNSNYIKKLQLLKHSTTSTTTSTTVGVTTMIWEETWNDILTLND
jgi:hypothetical protein